MIWPGRAHREAASAMVSTYSVTKTVEESDARIVFVYANQSGKPGGEVYVATGGERICAASVDFADAAF